MKLVFALGNPGPQYATTRHNVGFAIADAMTDKAGVSWKDSRKFKALIAELTTEQGKLIIAKPSTYYNLIGESYQALTSFYDIEPSEVLIVHDDLALDFGTIRTRLGGSGGGSKGIRSLNAHGGDKTYRLRVGVSNPLAERIDSADFVLSRFTAEEAKQLPEVIERALAIVDDFSQGKIEATTHRS